MNVAGRGLRYSLPPATDSQSKDKDIREKLVQTGHVDVMVRWATTFFYTKSLPCTLWFFDKGKKEELLDKVLFIDARKLLHRGRSHSQRVERLAAQEPERHRRWLYRGETDKYIALLSEYDKAIKAAVSSLPETGRKLESMLGEAIARHFTGNMPRVEPEFDVDALKSSLENYIGIVKTSTKLAFEETKSRNKKSP